MSDASSVAVNVTGRVPIRITVATSPWRSGARRSNASRRAASQRESDVALAVALMLVDPSRRRRR
jgi:hypothetical protein